MSLYLQPIQKNSGQAMTEFIIIAFVLLLLTLGVIQLILVYQTKTNLNYATFEAVRAGTLNNASPESIKQGFARGMAPSHIRVIDAPNISVTSQDSRNAAVGAAYDRANDEIESGFVAIERINPTTALFVKDSGWGQPIPSWEIEQENLEGKATQYIPNEHLLYKSASQDAFRAGVSIHDANILKIQITYCMELIVPFVNTIFENAFKLIYTNSSSVFVEDETEDRGDIKTLNQDCIDNEGRRIPIVSQGIMRMQSPARNYTF